MHEAFTPSDLGPTSAGRSLCPEAVSPPEGWGGDDSTADAGRVLCIIRSGGPVQSVNVIKHDQRHVYTNLWFLIKAKHSGFLNENFHICQVCSCLWHLWNMIFEIPNSLGVSRTFFHIESFQFAEMQQNFGRISDLLAVQNTCQWRPTCILPPSTLSFIYWPLGKPGPSASHSFTLYSSKCWFWLDSFVFVSRNS